MSLPEVGARIGAGAYATVLRVEAPNSTGNVRVLVEDDRGHLGWLMYYPDAQGRYTSERRSNINYFRPAEAEAMRARLAAEPGE